MPPGGMDGLEVIKRETRVGNVFTVRVALAEILPEMAVIVVVPVVPMVFAKARPVWGSIVATEGSDEDQVTRVVISGTDPLL